MNHAAAIAEVHAAMDRLEPEPEHTRHVAMLAVRLFDESKKWHGLGPDERVILEGASCLHDVGWPVSRKGAAHHKHSARLIRAQTWAQFNAVEVEMLALVARYHRKSHPSPDHEDYERLSRTRRKKVSWLASLLRLADAFDRSHLQHVQDLSLSPREHSLEVTLVSRLPPEREIAAAGRKGKLAEEMFECELTYRYRPLAPLRPV
jgi:exopolyphosphatase/guanosine-5'-triphosphate,3'-diphosphate pyrophosphatase